MSSSTEDRRVILVTGANKGIGFEAVRQLSERLPNSTVLLGTRSIANGQQALNRLQHQQAASPSSHSNIHLLELDVTSRPSIARAVEQVKASYGPLHVLINNSGISHVGGQTSSPGVLSVNLYGVHDTIEAFLPVLAADATLITVSSEVGAWTAHGLDAELQRLLTDVPSLSWSALDGLAQDYTARTKGEKTRYKWPDPNRFYGMYGISKALVSAYTRVVAREQEGKLKVAVVCPGYCATDLNSHRGTRPASAGGTSVIWPVLHPFESGEFYQDGKKHPWLYPAPHGF